MFSLNLLSVLVKIFAVLFTLQVGKMAAQIQALDSQAWWLRTIPGAHLEVEGENWRHRFVLSPLHVRSVHTRMRTCARTINTATNDNDSKLKSLKKKLIL